MKTVGSPTLISAAVICGKLCTIHPGRVKPGKKLSLNAIGGPCTSYELVAHDQTEVAFCGNDIKILSNLRELMQTDYYHISITTDVTGIESAVALKNGYALGIALTIGNQVTRIPAYLFYSSWTTSETPKITTVTFATTT